MKKRPNDASTYCGRYGYCKWDEYSTSLPWCQVRAPNFGRLFLTIKYGPVRFLILSEEAQGRDCIAMYIPRTVSVYSGSRRMCAFEIRRLNR